MPEFQIGPLSNATLFAGDNYIYAPRPFVVGTQSTANTTPSNTCTINGMLACGGRMINSIEDIQESDLGFAKVVYEQSLGEDKYTFIEGVENPFSCTILIKGPNDYTIAQTRDAIKDGLRAVTNAI